MSRCIACVCAGQPCAPCANARILEDVLSRLDAVAPDASPPEYAAAAATALELLGQIVVYDDDTAERLARARANFTATIEAARPRGAA